jgi:hypothetical protein
MASKDLGDRISDAHTGSITKAEKRLIKDDPETLAAWRDAVTPPHGGNHQTKSDNVTLDGRGNSRSYTLARLKRERLD